MNKLPKFAIVAIAAVVLVTSGGTVSLPGNSAAHRAAQALAAGCPVGYHPEYLESEPGGLSAETKSIMGDSAIRLSGCVSDKHPESLLELQGGFEQKFAQAAAPTGVLPKDSLIRAIRQMKQVRRQGQKPANRHAWKPVGKGPLRAADKKYPGVSGLGLVNLAGRITDFAYIGRNDKTYPNTLLTSVVQGGIWKSKDQGKHWKHISKKLPTQIVGSVGYTPYRHTIVTITGDGSFGRSSREGAGAYWTSNGGRKWHRSKGVPSGAFGFNVATDPAHPKRVYVATGTGLFRSNDGGRSFKNVKLPTGECAGKSNRVKKCLLANIVTDVVVKYPAGATDEKGGQVLAVVGWRGGSRENPDGTVQSPNNGLYLSETGKPGSFTKLIAPGFTEQERIGRVELGNAIGPDQDHNYVYAIVQDAVLLRTNPPEADAPVIGQPSRPTAFAGIYVSPDFGESWVQMANAADLESPSSGSALSATAALGVGPGIQSWYNEWIIPDPTKQVGGVPTRLLFGLEEIWENDQTDVPQTGKSSFHAIGRYFAGDTCLFLLTNVPVCPTDRDDPLDETTTTHPDQQSAIIIPQPDPETEGGALLVAGNDGGVYTQLATEGDDFDNAHWGKGANTGFRTLLPYDAVQSDDGTVWMGLQDNGTAKIQDVRDPKTKKIIARQRQIETLGGDGFFVGVDPINSDLAYGEYTYGAMSGTENGGITWNAMSPPGLDATTAQFSNQFVVDPKNARHVMTAGNQVVETKGGPGTAEADWSINYKLGTAKHPGDQDATGADDDPINKMSAIDMYGANAYVGFCGTCEVLDSPNPFKNGLATNVGGNKPPKQLSSNGWHIAKKKGLPNRNIASIAIKPKNPKKVYVALGGYARSWTPPNFLDKNLRVGRGHIFVSRDAGNHFRNVSANLPNTPANWVALRGRQILVATDVGVYASKPGKKCRNYASRKCHLYQLLGRGLPKTQISTVRVAPCDKNLLTVATFGAGVWQYRFGKPTAPCKHPKPIPPPPFLDKPVAGPFGFETDAEGWTTGGGGGPEDFRLGPPGHESVQSFQVAPYNNDSSYSVTSPKLKLPERSLVKVTWWQRVNTEECCDFLSLEYSSDGQNASSAAGINGSYPLFDEAKAKFVAPAGDLYIRFRLTADALVNGEGVNVDDVVIKR
jgi:hypothetical protein